MTDEYPRNAPFKDSASTNNLVDLPEVSTGRRRNDSTLIPGVPDKYLMIGGIAVSSIIGLAALSQTPAIQNLIKRVTNRGAPPGRNDEEGETIQVPEQHSHQAQQPQGFRVVNQDPRAQRQQQAEATAIAQQIALQEQERQSALQQADTPGQVDASMYDRIVGGKDSNSIKAYRIDNRRRNYTSPFGASFSSS
jgi:hypothetical protein